MRLRRLACEGDVPATLPLGLCWALLGRLPASDLVPRVLWAWEGLAWLGGCSCGCESLEAGRGMPDAYVVVGCAGICSSRKMLQTRQCLSLMLGS
jgi:hypothetical protein